MKFLGSSVCAAVLAAALGSMGQTIPGDMVVDVPFDFVVKQQTLPAGHYVVGTMNDREVRISGSRNLNVYVATHAALRSNSDGSKLVFHRYGEIYFLSALWVTGKTSGRELPRSPVEREVAGGKVEMELALVRPGKFRK
jgi:hypothetical protein